MNSRIPLNKVRKGFLEWSFSGQARLRVVLLLLAVVLPWRKPKTAVTCTLHNSFFNKACSSAFCCCKSFLSLSPPACGGSLEFENGLVIHMRWPEAGSFILLMDEVFSFSFAHIGGVGRKRNIRRDVEKKLSWSSDTEFWSTISAAFFCRPTLKASWWPYSPEFPGICSTSMRRPCAELDVALNISFESSGVVPGAEDDGRGWSSLVSDEDDGGGPNCISPFLYNVFFVKFRGLVVISDFLLVPNVNCTCRWK